MDINIKKKKARYFFRGNYGIHLQKPEMLYGNRSRVILFDFGEQNRVRGRKLQGNISL